MSRKRKNTYRNGKPDLLKSLASLDLNELDRLSKTVPVLLQSKLQSSMMSKDVEDVMKANLYLGSKTSDNGKLQSVFFDPQVWNDTGRDYLAQRGILPFSTLRRMGGIYLVRAIVNTRIEQIQNFLHFSDDEQKEGYTIRKKRGLFDLGDLSLSSKDKKKVEKIVEFLEHGGNTEKWDSYDTLPGFIRKISFDSLTLDQLAFETTRNRMWELDRFKAVDASLIRYLGAIDPRNRQEFEKYRFKGYLPRYCMVWDNQILKNPVTGESIVYYPWELGFGVRNKSTDVYRNGYGVSELETLNEIVTWFLWSLQSNGNSFKNGVFPKGLLNIKGENVSQTTLNEFRQMWYQMMAGPQNAGRIPVLAQSQVEWIDLQKCLHPDSEVITEDGKKTLDSILGEKESVVSKIWDGEGFEECKIYRTQEKRICSLTLSNRMTLKTSSEHKFLVLRDSKPTWVERKNIVLGDYVLVNKNVIEKKRTLTFKEKEVEWDLVKSLATSIRLYNRSLPKEQQLSKKHIHDVQNIGKGYQIASLEKIKYYANMVGYKLPEFVNNYSFCEVVELEESDETVRMVDVEMFNDKHQFVANGMVVHNCNKDMEYNLWNQFLIVLICSVYRIDPSELGFQFKESAQMFGQDGQRQRLKHSREKGLKPMLSFLQEIITRYLVSELDESFEFAFTGVDLEDEALKVEIDKKKLEAGMISLEDAFEAYSGRPFNPEKDTILNSVWMNYKINKDNAAAMGGQMNGGEVEGVENEEEQPSSNVAAEEEDPFAKYKSMYGDNPIMDRATEVINKMFGGE